ncbi:hypothetical protein PM082_021543 [Marasmius tenuissimus]|nr:hypothetical protein PM082_021543 [Marasmius tenuissimus]
MDGDGAVVRKRQIDVVQTRRVGNKVRLTGHAEKTFRRAERNKIQCNDPTTSMRLLRSDSKPTPLVVIVSTRYHAQSTTIRFIRDATISWSSTVVDFILSWIYTAWFLSSRPCNPCPAWHSEATLPHTHLSSSSRYAHWRTVTFRHKGYVLRFMSRVWRYAVDLN